MARTRRFTITVAAIAAVTLTVGVTLAVVVWMPLPEERVFTKLSMVTVGPIDWTGVYPEDAVAEVNSQLEKKGETHLRLSISKAARMDGATVSLHFDRISVAELTRYITELSGKRMVGTDEGITIDLLNCYGSSASGTQRPSWRKEFRHWVRYTLPYEWEKFWYRPDPTDPFAPAGPPSGPAPAPPSAPSAGPFAPPPGASVDPFGIPPPP